MLNIINMIEDEILHVYRKLDQAKQKIIKNIQKVPLLKLQINMNPFVTLRAGTSKKVRMPALCLKTLPIGISIWQKLRLSGLFPGIRQLLKDWFHILGTAC